MSAVARLISSNYTHFLRSACPSHRHMNPTFWRKSHSESQSLFIQAEELEKKGQFVKAADIYETAIDANPTDAEAYERLWNIWMGVNSLKVPAHVLNNFFTKYEINIQQSRTKRKVVVLGDSNIGFRIAQGGVERGHPVIITTRKREEDLPRIKGMEFVHTPRHELVNHSFWKRFAYDHIHEGEDLLLVNSIGGSIPSEGTTIKDLNVTIPITAICAITEFVNELRGSKQLDVVQLSSIVAGRVDAPYAREKRSTEALLSTLPIERVTMLRAGHVVERLVDREATQILKAQHRLFAEQMALLPLFPMIGEADKVKMQTVSIDDIVTAVYNSCTLSPGTRIIDAVSREVLTQQEFFQFFSTLLGKKFNPISIPVEIAEKIVEHHAYGHFVPYVVKYCKMHGIVADHQSFEKLLGKQAKTLKDDYALTSDQKLLIPRPSIPSYGMRVMQNLWKNPSSRQDTWEAVKTLAPSLLSILRPTAEHEGKMEIKPVQYKTTSEKNFNQNSLRNRL